MRLRWRDEWRDFLRFLRRPALAPRLHASTSLALRLLQWAALLWLVNLLFLAPLAAAAAYAGGAQHRLLGMASIPWLQALLWAPVVEELLFRYGLRRPAQALWVVPTTLLVLFYGMHWPSAALLATLIGLLVWQARQHAKPLSWAWRKAYARAFPWVFYAASTAFALLHLWNFQLHQTPLWLLPLLVLPQWCTGLVLGWLRVRRGIGASIMLHALFNGGPLLLVYLLLGALA